ncbi:MAG: 50S ribosomal protein L25/general stress protein Ctc [Rhodanobacter sp.]|jgi:large subunit ribosomal protein L25|nr:50S ribosomal protein L25/general stress protein Ctc [Rhodanobacter sp.]
MAKTHEIKAQSRKDEGKGASRRLRHASFVPAVVYGAGQDPQSIQIEHNTILLAAKHEWFFSSVLDLNVDGKVQKVLVRDWQKHPFKQLMMHMDFLRIDENKAVRVNVPLHFLNQDTSPAGKTSGVVVSHNLTEVEVSCLPKDLPEFIELDLGALKEGDIIHLSQLTLPANIEIPELLLGEAHDIPVVTVTVVKESAADVAEDAAAEAEAEAAKSAATKSAKPAADKK